jgi:hypothetical protein
LVLSGDFSPYLADAVKGMGNQLLCVGFGPLEVTFGQAFAADVVVVGQALRYGLQVVV